MRKPLPINPADATELRLWTGETREFLGELREIALDATAPHRVYSRKELRRRACKVARRLAALLDALDPLGGGAVGSDPSGESSPDDGESSPDDGDGAPDAT